ncbi:MAG: hypothetical protein V1824_00335 [archaeon]
MEKYEGRIIEESLIDNRILNKYKIIKVTITDDHISKERWHIYNILVTRKEIEKLSKSIKHGWFMHFWDINKKGLVVYKNKIFEINYHDKKTHTEAINYGLLAKISRKHLIFEIEK